MKKGKDSKKVNRMVRRFNRQLRQDVFGNRFEIRQIQKAKGDGLEWFRFELRDNEDPERNTDVDGWFNVYSVDWKLFQAMNDFIVRSNFWAKWFNDESRYDKERDFYKNY